MPLRQAECKRGHPMAGENLYVSPKGLRMCIECRNSRSRAHYEANKQAYVDRVAARRLASPDRSEECRRYYEKHRERHLSTVERWRKANPDAVRDIRENRRARELAAFVEHVDRKLVWVKARGMCGICRSPVSLSRMELDHIIPLSRGGLHHYGNCQPAHRTCNRRKFNKVVA